MTESYANLPMDERKARLAADKVEDGFILKVATGLKANFGVTKNVLKDTELEGWGTRANELDLWLTDAKKNAGYEANAEYQAKLKERADLEKQINARFRWHGHDIFQDTNPKRAELEAMGGIKIPTWTQVQAAKHATYTSVKENTGTIGFLKGSTVGNALSSLLEWVMTGFKGGFTGLKDLMRKNAVGNITGDFAKNVKAAGLSPEAEAELTKGFSESVHHEAGMPGAKPPAAVKLEDIKIGAGMPAATSSAAGMAAASDAAKEKDFGKASEVLFAGIGADLKTNLGGLFKMAEDAKMPISAATKQFALDTCDELQKVGAAKLKAGGKEKLLNSDALMSESLLETLENMKKAGKVPAELTAGADQLITDLKAGRTISQIAATHKDPAISKLLSTVSSVSNDHVGAFLKTAVAEGTIDKAAADKGRVASMAGVVTAKETEIKKLMGEVHTTIHQSTRNGIDTEVTVQIRKKLKEHFAPGIVKPTDGDARVQAVKDGRAPTAAQIDGVAHLTAQAVEQVLADPKFRDAGPAAFSSEVAQRIRRNVEDNYGLLMTPSNKTYDGKPGLAGTEGQYDVGGMKHDVAKMVAARIENNIEGSWTKLSAVRKEYWANQDAITKVVEEKKKMDEAGKPPVDAATAAKAASDAKIKAAEEKCAKCLAGASDRMKITASTVATGQLHSMSLGIRRLNRSYPVSKCREEGMLPSDAQSEKLRMLAAQATEDVMKENGPKSGFSSEDFSNRFKTRYLQLIDANEAQINSLGSFKIKSTVKNHGQYHLALADALAEEVKYGPKELQSNRINYLVARQELEKLQKERAEAAAKASLTEKTDPKDASKLVLPVAPALPAPELKR